MKKTLQALTNKMITRKGVWLTLAVWVVAATVLSMFAPGSKEYSVNNVSKLYPETSPSEMAQQKVDEYFKDDDGIPAIFVLEARDGTLDEADIQAFSAQLQDTEIPYAKSIIPLHQLPPEAFASFISEDEKALFVPGLFEEGITSKEIKQGLDAIAPIADEYHSFELYVTGPAGIAVDATDLFSRADLVLLFSTVGIILILLIFTYRSPLLALIPLLAAVFVYAVADRLLGLLGQAGVELASQSLSIMMILLFAVVIDYSLFIFSRFREELKQHDDKYHAMRLAMQEIGVPIFYSSSTVLIAMLVLFFAKFGDYKNFAPIFSIAVVVVMIAAVTLIPTLFTLFGRRAFWPKIPRVDDEAVGTSSLWSKIGSFVVGRPVMSVVTIIIFLLLTAANVLTITYEYNTMKSFPDDMPSRVGYDILEDKFSRGALAPTTLIVEAKDEISKVQNEAIIRSLEKEKIVDTVRMTNRSNGDSVVQFDVIFTEDPYDVKTIDALEDMMENESSILADADIDGALYFAGETAASADNRKVNNRDLVVIVIIETILIFGMLIFLTRSLKITSLMMGTILLSFLAALGLGTFLSGMIFDVHSISNRVPVYAFVFLVALGIDYNIFLVSRYLEEKKHYPVKEAVQRAVASTGGVISSAGVILAATFAVLITQPVEVLYIFGFIVAIGILMDTFLIRGVLLPGLLVLLEKDKTKK